MNIVYLRYNAILDSIYYVRSTIYCMLHIVQTHLAEYRISAITTTDAPQADQSGRNSQDNG